MSAAHPQRPSFALMPKIVNGGLAGMIGTCCVFPLDLVKTRLQKQQLGPDGQKMYKNMFDCFVKTFKAEGFFGMYRGIGTVLVLCTPEKAIKLAANDYFRYHLTTAEGQLSLARQCLAGGIAGGFQVLVSTPMELLKIQQQDAGRIKASGSTEKVLTTWAFTKDLIRTRGFFGLYKGIGPTLQRDVWFSFVYFPLFAAFNDLGPRKEDGSGEAVPWVSFLSGLGSGAVSALVVTPFDVVKTRLQTFKKAKGEKGFNGMLDCFQKTFANEGITAFFKGGLCRMIVIAPLYGVAQTIYFLGVAEWILGVKK